MTPDIHSTPISDPADANRRAHRLALAGLAVCLIVYFALRLRWVGHLLTWDEAMAVCTSRAFVSGGRDDFSNWFWRHPPLFSWLLTLLSPLREGFAQRAQLLTIEIGAINLLLLFILVQRLRGMGAALWSAFFLAVMPAGIFFDVWLKGDHLVATFGLLSLLLLQSGRTLPAAASLGFALLSKETAVFYWIAALLLYLSGASPFRSRKGVLVLLGVPVVAAAWWFVFFQNPLPPPGAAPPPFLDGLLYLFRFAGGQQAPWIRSWTFYFAKLPLYLGWIGLTLAAYGIVLLLPTVLSRPPRPASAAEPRDPSVRFALWPAAVLLPAYLALALAPAKVAWVTISLAPAWAALEGMAVHAILCAFRKRTAPATRPLPAPPLAAVLCGAAIGLAALVPVAVRDYESVLRQTDADQWRGATYSREAAEALNLVVRDNERILLTSFHYWKGLSPGHACPVFACYFRRKSEILLRPHTRTFAELADDIAQYRLDWALLSPEPGPDAEKVFGGFMRQWRLTPWRLQRAYLFRTAGLRADRERPPTVVPPPTP